MTDAIESTAPEIDDAANKPTGRVEGVFERNDHWLLVAAGICLAGAFYPAIVVLGFSFVGLAVETIDYLGNPQSNIFPQLITLLPAVMMIGVAAVAAGCIGAVWTGFLSVIVVPIFYLFARSLRLRASLVWLGAICGGLVGFVAVLPFLLNFRGGSGADILGMLLVAAVGPGLTTVLGQLGGAWGGRQAQRNRERTIEYHLTQGGGGERLLQFQIRHLLWVTVWLALLLTGIRLSGIPAQLILPVLLAWLVYQAGTLYCGWLWFARLWPWWMGLRGAEDVAAVRST
jgi:hypothetical protein